MKTEKNILTAFLLNITFSIFELLGGIYTYGYTRYSILGAITTNLILITGSVLVIKNAITRIINPVQINYNGMIILSIFGIIINFLAVSTTKKGNSLNQKAVNLHMIEDVLGWLVVLIGSIIIKFTKINLIDSIMSIGVALFISINALKSLKSIINIFLEKVPNEIDIDELKKHILKIKNIQDVHHIHIWSIDGFNNYATMHIVSNTKNQKELKDTIKEELIEHGISHVTIEVEKTLKDCSSVECNISTPVQAHNHHH